MCAEYFLWNKITEREGLYHFYVALTLLVYLLGV